jgi:nicotinamidase-related amidase
VLPAADAGASVTVVTDACAGSTDGAHQKALDVMALYQPLVAFTTTEELVAAAAGR